MLPHGLQGGALAHITDASDEDVDMESQEDGWKPEYLQWWFDFLNEKGGKGVSKDTWNMVCFPFFQEQFRLNSFRRQFLDFIRTINSKFSNYDMEG